jgi:DNA invertase Pin-like site-specific DNA recombinase
MTKTLYQSSPQITSTCIIYCRVSSYNQSKRTSVSLDAQEYLSKQMAQAKGYRIKKVYKDVSGAYKSPMKALKEILMANKNTHIFIYDVSRFCRNVINGMKLLEIVLSKNNTLVFVHDQLTINSQNIDVNLEKFRDVLKQSETESEKLSSRIKMVKKYLKDQGKYIGGCIPYGYTVIKSINPSKNNILAEDTYEQNVIAFINMCRKQVISSQKLNYLMKKISHQVPHIKIQCYDNDQETAVTAINTPLTNAEITRLLNEYHVKKRGLNWTVSLVRKIKNEVCVEPMKFNEDIPCLEFPIHSSR